MPPGLVLDKLDLNLSSPSFLVALWLVIIVVVVAAAVYGVPVIDKRVVSNARVTRMRVLRISWVACHVHSRALLHETNE